MAVAIVTVTDDAAGPRSGTTTEHDVWLEQLVEAGAPSKAAVMSPFLLNRCEPVTSTVWPAAPPPGAMAVSCGAPVGVPATAGAAGGPEEPAGAVRPPAVEPLGVLVVGPP